MKGLSVALLALTFAQADAHSGSLRAASLNEPKSISQPVVHAAPVTVPVAAAAVVSKHETVQEITDHTDFAAMSRQYMDQAMHLGAKEMMHFLMSQGSNATLPKFDRFLPACISHSQRIMRRVDLSYTDEQLHTVLINECGYERSFPNTFEDGWNHQKACKDYADDLCHARDVELANPKTCATCGYKSFCTKYYLHKGGTVDGKKLEKAEVKKETKTKEKSDGKDTPPLVPETVKTDEEAVAKNATQMQASWLPFFLIFILVIVGVALCYLKRSRGGV